MWHEFCSTGDLLKKTWIVKWIGNKEVCALSHKGKVLVFNSICPHMGGPLAEGKILEDDDGKVKLQCPWHGYIYDLSSGDSVTLPALKMTFYQSKVENKKILIQLDEECSK